MRHGLVENPANVIYGALPGFGLSKVGRKEVADRAKELAKYPYTKIICSPLQRTKETAQIVQETAFPNLAIETDERLIEWVYVSQGLTREEWQAKYPKLRETYKGDVYSLPTEVDGKHYESFAEMEERIQAFIDEYKQTGGLILAISHGDPVTLAMALETDQSYRHYRENDYVSTAEVRTLNYQDGGVTITEYPA